MKAHLENVPTRSRRKYEWNIPVSLPHVVLYGETSHPGPVSLLQRTDDDKKNKINTINLVVWRCCSSHDTTEPHAQDCRDNMGHQQTFRIMASLMHELIPYFQCRGANLSDYISNFLLKHIRGPVGFICSRWFWLFSAEGPQIKHTQVTHSRSLCQHQPWQRRPAGRLRKTSCCPFPKYMCRNTIALMNTLEWD